MTRNFTIAAAVLSISLLAAQPAPPPGPGPKLEKIKDDLYLIENANANLDDLRNYGGNVTVYLTNEGVLLVDCKFDQNHDDVVAKVKSLTDKPIKYVVLTHNHADHAGGAAKMQAMGASLLISSDDRDNMVRAKQTGVPDVGYAGRVQVTLAGKQAQLRQFRGHTRGDTIVYFPAERVISMGDLLTTSEQIPLIVNYGDGGTWMDWSRSIDEILKLDFDVAIPGHGPMVTKAQIVTIRNRMEKIFERVRALNREKKNQEEITQALVKEFNWGAGPSAGNIPGMMQELR